MTKRNFLAFCEQYYGEKYDGIRLDVMDGYLEGKSGMFLDAAAGVLVKRFSRIYGKAPGPAEIEKYWDEILGSIPEPSPLPDQGEYISDEERGQIGDLLHNLAKRLSGGAISREVITGNQVPGTGKTGG
ncbi:MAG: hypothetical protein LBK83_11650 [Treponema sp.]|jgi:hypothetical protein|nr:hypothetical protein [Treponema sp.]